MSSTRRKTLTFAAALAAGSVALSLFVAELVLRVSEDDVELFTLRNFAESKLDLFQSAYPAAYDAELGWVPRRGYRGEKDNIWKTRVRIDDAGLRENGRPPPPGPPVVVVGDSFAFGDEVNDEDTLPARLEERLGRRVLNAGVFGYGFDQTLLRAERLAERYAPSAIVVQLVKDDLERMKLSLRTGVQKPYFVLEDGALALKNVPTSPDRPRIEDVGFVRRVFGYSYLVDWSMRRLGNDAWWYVGNWPSTAAHQDTDLTVQVSCRLLSRLREKTRAQNTALVLLAEYGAMTVTAPATHPDLAPIQRVLECGRRSEYAVIDTFEIFKAQRARDPGGFGRLYAAVHLSRAGNDFVAGLVQNALGVTQPTLTP